jgi:hypothetical protein
MFQNNKLQGQAVPDLQPSGSGLVRQWVDISLLILPQILEGLGVPRINELIHQALSEAETQQQGEKANEE